MSVRNFTGFVVAISALWFGSGCTAEGYCFSGCDEELKSGESGGSGGDTSSSGGSISFGGKDGGGGTVAIGGSGNGNCGLDEICDGIDNDCDGQIDEDFDFTQPETCGTCSNDCRTLLVAAEQDSITCTPPDEEELGKKAGSCTFSACAPDFWDADGEQSTGCELYCVWNPEGKNTTDPGGATGCGKDDDCDGLIDEDVDTCDEENCGRCGHQCVVPNATAQCTKQGDAEVCNEDNTQCTVKKCNEGYYDLDGASQNGCEYQCTPNGAETCDGVDNDCDGLIDNADPDLDAKDSEVGSSCQGGTQGVCAAKAHQGVRKCIDAQVKCCDKASNSVASPYPNFPSTGVQNGVCDDPDQDPTQNGVVFPGDLEEKCNNLDDDCDGSKDEIIDLVDDGKACGPHQGICQQGTEQCVAGKLVCLGATTPGVEVCNGTDDDCDGVVDGIVGASPVECTGNASACTGGRVCRKVAGSSKSYCADPPSDVATRSGNTLTIKACNVPPSPPCWNKLTGDAVACNPQDPNVEALPQACSAGVLLCDGGAKVCSGDQSASVPGDACGQDSNCNGTYDAEVDFLLDENNCGGCGRRCGEPGDNRAWFCDNGDCHEDAVKGDPDYVPCLPGFTDCDGDGKCTTTCVYRGPEQCNGVDDDCDCSVDEDSPKMVRPTMAETCGVSAGATDAACKDTNVLKCQGGAWVCDFSTLYPGYCTNGGNCLASPDPCETIAAPDKDNNCSGVANEEFLFPVRTARALGQACFSDDGLPFPGHGDCRREGVYDCNGAGTDTVCSATTKDTSKVHQEECNGEDDDCDGLVDEYKNTNSAGSYVIPAVVQVGSTYVFQFEASRPDANHETPGSGNGYHVDASSAPLGTPLDQTLACSTAGRLPWFNVTPDEAMQTCEAIGGRLCSRAEWTDACNGTSNSCSWAYGASCTSPANYSSGPYCNLASFVNSSSVLVTQSNQLSQCWSELGAKDIFDLTGNLREITQGSSNYPLMGGAFNTESEAGAACSFDFYSVGLQFSLYDTGFRCCFDQSPL